MTFFSHYNLFKEKLEEKLARKARVNTERVYRIVLMPPGHSIILLKYVCRIGKKVYSFLTKNRLILTDSGERY